MSCVIIQIRIVANVLVLQVGLGLSGFMAGWRLVLTQSEVEFGHGLV
jgi:hypothetical protein